VHFVKLLYDWAILNINWPCKLFLMFNIFALSDRTCRLIE
jgi:hypothetical protein